MEEKLYWYKGIVRRVYDADTIFADLDLGFGHVYKGDNGKGVPIRLAFINAPEIRGEERPEGLVSKEWLQGKLPDGAEVILNTIKWSGKYGRYIAEVFLPEEGESLNNQLVKLGYAEEVEY